MNKRGFLLGEETLKIIIAVIAIMLLIGFLAAIYMTYNTSAEEKQAQATLDRLKEAIDSKTEEFTIYNPSSNKVFPGTWSLLSWPYQNENKLPSVCSINGWENCLCVTRVNINPSRANYLEESEICVESSKVIVSDSGSQSIIQLKDLPINLKINYGQEINIQKA